MQIHQFKVSVIIPVYNCEKFLMDSVESALSLNEVGEVVLIDDGSTDNSIFICNSLQYNNSRVKFFKHRDSKNLGPAASRNLGIINATCEYVSFLDADDIYLSNRFFEEKKIFSSNLEIDAVYGCSHTVFISEWGKQQYYKVDSNHIYTVTKYIPPEELFTHLLLYWNGRIHTSAITIKKSAFNRSGLFNEKLRWAEDTEMWLRLAYLIKMMPGNITEPIAIRRIHDSNTVHQLAKARKFNDKMYHTLLDWIIEKKPTFRVFNNILNAQKNYSYCYKNISTHKFILINLIAHPKLFFTSYFWKKVKLLYFNYV